MRAAEQLGRAVLRRALRLEAVRAHHVRARVEPDPRQLALDFTGRGWRERDVEAIFGPAREDEQEATA
jgi:hypothetical protein